MCGMKTVGPVELDCLTSGDVQLTNGPGQLVVKTPYGPLLINSERAILVTEELSPLADQGTLQSAIDYTERLFGLTEA